MAISNLDFEGTYDDGLNGRPMRRFIVKNWTDEDVYSKWDGQPIIIKKGDLYECGHAIALKLTREIVDREIFREASKAPTDKERERKEMGVLSPMIREPYEKKTLQEVKMGEENPIVAKMREEIRAEEAAKLQNSASDSAAGITDSGKRTRVRKPDEFVEAQ